MNLDLFCHERLSSHSLLKEMFPNHFQQQSSLKTNIAKGTTNPRVKFISQVITQILIKQFQNFDKALTSKSQPNISISTKLKLKILAKPSLRILTKIQLRNLNQTSTAKFRILTKHCAQSLNKSLALCPNLSF